MPPVDEGMLNKWRSFLLGILGSVLILLMGVIWGVRARHALEGGPTAAPNVGTIHVSPSTERSGVAVAEVNQKRGEMRRRSLASYAMVSLGVISFVASWFVFKFPKLSAAVMGIAAVVPAILAPTSLVVGWLLLGGCWAGFRARDPEKEVLDELVARWLAGLGPEQRQEGLEILQEAVVEGCRYPDGRLVPAAGSPELIEMIQDGLDGYARSLGGPGIETMTPAERFSRLRLRAVRRSISRLSEASAALGKGLIDGQVTPEAARTQGQALLKDIARIAPKVRTLTNPGEIWVLERELNEVHLEAQLAIEGRMRTPRVLHEQIHRLSDASYALGKGIIDGQVTPDAARTQGEAIVKEVGEIAKEVEAIVSNVGTLAASPDVTRRLERDLNEVRVEAQYAVDGRMMSPRLNRYTSERELVEGKPIQLGDGTTVEVHKVLYAHVSGGENLSLCTLYVTRDGQTTELALKLDKDGVGSPDSREVFGWRFTLKMADPYQSPSRALVHVERVDLGSQGRAPRGQKTIVDELAASWLAGLGPDERGEGLAILEAVVADWCRTADCTHPAVTEAIEHHLYWDLRYGREGYRRAMTPGERLDVLRALALRGTIQGLNDTSYALGKGIIDGQVTPDAARMQGKALMDETATIAPRVRTLADVDVIGDLERSLNDVRFEAQYAIDGRIMSPRLNRYTSERELVEGKPIQLGDGTTVEVHNVGAAQLVEGRNLSFCTLRLDHGGQTKEMRLSIVYGGDKPPESVESFGWRFTLMTSDPHHRPSKASVRVERVVPG